MQPGRARDAAEEADGGARGAGARGARVRGAGARGAGA